MSATDLLNNSFVKKIRRPLGRIRRWLRSRPARTLRQREKLLRDSTLTLSDLKLLEQVEVAFCAEFLGAEAAYSEQDLSRLALGREFDLIWCGSLVTHLDDEKILELLKAFSRHLVVGGLVIFTAPGDQVLARMTSG